MSEKKSNTSALQVRAMTEGGAGSSGIVASSIGRKSALQAEEDLQQKKAILQHSSSNNNVLTGIVASSIGRKSAQQAEEDLQQKKAILPQPASNDNTVLTVSKAALRYVDEDSSRDDDPQVLVPMAPGEQQPQLRRQGYTHGSRVNHYEPGAFTADRDGLRRNDKISFNLVDGGVDQPPTELEQRDTVQGNNNDVEAVANPVDQDGTEGRQDLPKAEEYEHKGTLNNKESHGQNSKSIYFIVGMVLVMVLAVLLSVLFSSGETTSSPTGTRAPTKSSTVQLLEEQLPSYTLEAVANDPTSPQAIAYEWLLEDPNQSLYSQQRLLQRYVLAVLFFSSNGPSWHTNTNWVSYSKHECEWYMKPSFAAKMELGYVYTGYLDTWNVSDYPCPGYNTNNASSNANNNEVLQHLWLDQNKLEGTIPLELYLLTSLKSVSMGTNPLLHGSIPSQIGLLSSLEGLGLFYLPLTHTIPSQISALTNLKVLGLFLNGLGGPIPNIAPLKQLEHLHLDGNLLTGTLTPRIGQLSKLRMFTINTSLLTGRIPSQFGLLQDLRWMALEDSQCSGNIPSELGLLTHATVLGLLKNAFFGPIPAQLGQMEALEVFSVRSNQLSSTIPSELGLLTNVIDVFALSDNQLTGSIPVELASLSQVTWMWLFGNELSGSLPPELGLLSNMISLLLQENKLTGVVPEEIGNAASLKELNISSNALSGTLPEQLCDRTCPLVAEFPPKYATIRTDPLYFCSGLFFDCGQVCGCNCSCEV